LFARVAQKHIKKENRRGVKLVTNNNGATRKIDGGESMYKRRLERIDV
jgi:hypothetical protein